MATKKQNYQKEKRKVRRAEKKHMLQSPRRDALMGRVCRRNYGDGGVDYGLPEE